nr:type I-U CRISPR-associated protein Csb2 [Sediminivirga luteola]
MAIDVHWYRNSYHGLRADGTAEWPPSPARLLGALMAGAYRLQDPTAREHALAAIRRISAAPPPVLDVPEVRPLNIPDTYTEKTWSPVRITASDAKNWLNLEHLSMPTSSRAAKPQDGVALADSRLTAYVDVDLPATQFDSLVAAAAEVPYFGRSHDPADIVVRRAEKDEPAQLAPTGTRRTLRPRQSRRGDIRGWLPHTVDWYEANHARILGEDPAINSLPPIPADGNVEWLRYVPAKDADGPCEIIPLDSSVPHHRIPGVIAQINQVLRDNTDSLELPWLAFAATVSAHAHADGRCVGVGITLHPAADVDPVSVGPEHLDRAAGAVEAALTGITLPGPGRRVGQPAALTANKWTRSSSRWVSVTPLREFPDDRVLEAKLTEALRGRFGVELTRLACRRLPIHDYEAVWSEVTLHDGFGQWWLEMELSEPIAGPLLLGASNEFGFGLLQPVEGAV